MNHHQTARASADARNIRTACGGDKSIAFVSGNFNVVHPGHLRLLKFAAEQADVLVVGVNSDNVSGVTLPQDLRLENVRSISIVDYAVGLDVAASVFIAALKPDIVVKGKEFETRAIRNRKLSILMAANSFLVPASCASHRCPCWSGIIPVLT